MTKTIEKPAKNTAYTFNSYTKKGNATWTLANVDGVFYLFRGRGFSMIVDAIQRGYEPLMKTLVYNGQDFKKVAQLAK